MVEQTRHYRPRHKVVAVHKSIGGTRGPGDTTAKSLVAHGPWEVPVELWIARQDNDTAFFYRPGKNRMTAQAETPNGGLCPPVSV